MPELPEVETVKRLLAPQIVGRHILEDVYKRQVLLNSHIRIFMK